MQILYWNTCLTTPAKPLFKHLMYLNHIYKNIDYLCLSEATPALIKLFQVNGWQIFEKANTPQRKSLLIASRHNLNNKRHYQLSSTAGRKRLNDAYLMLIDVQWRNQTLTLANTHLTYLRPKEMDRRRQERRKLVAYLPKNRTLLGGDFNTVILPFAKWDLKQVKYISHVKGKTWCWHLKRSLRRIPIQLQLDYVFSTPDIANSVSTKLFKPQKLSDHYPILVTLN